MIEIKRRKLQPKSTHYLVVTDNELNLLLSSCEDTISLIDEDKVYLSDRNKKILTHLKDRLLILFKDNKLVRDNRAE